MPVHLAVLNACIVKVEAHAGPEALQQLLMLGKHHRHFQDHLCAGLVAAKQQQQQQSSRRHEHTKSGVSLHPLLSSDFFHDLQHTQRTPGLVAAVNPQSI
jgi:hypothetical protein